MNQNALIVFVNNLPLGESKISGSKIMENQHQVSVVEHTLGCAKNLDCARFVFYSSFIPENDQWLEHEFHPCLQHGVDFGEYMLNASLYIFSRKFERLIMLDSTCFELESEQITKSFQMLDEKNVVIAPTSNGGYSLIGMNSLYPFLFFNKSWHTPVLLEETLEELNSHQLSYSLLPVKAGEETNHALDLQEEFLQENEHEFPVDN